MKRFDGSMLKIDKKKAGVKIWCRGDCIGDTKHVDMPYGSRCVWVCTICENTIEKE